MIYGISDVQYDKDNVSINVCYARNQKFLFKIMELVVEFFLSANPMLMWSKCIRIRLSVITSFYWGR